MASFLAALSCGIDAGIDWGIYLGLVKENFLHDLAAFVTSKFAIKPGKAFFLQTWEEGVALPYTSSYIYT